MSQLGAFRDHCAHMTTAQHKPECPSLTAVRPAALSLDRLTWEPPKCDGCVTNAERALFAQMAAEIDDYLAPQVDLFGDTTPEPTRENA